MLRIYGWLPLIGGTSAALIAIGSRYLIGAVYSAADAVQLIESLSRSGLYLGAAIATSCATILALMLTLLGFANRLDAEFDHTVYQRIDRIGLMSTLGMCGSLLLLLTLSLPVGEFEEMPTRWFPVLYNVLIVLVGLLTGLLIATVLLLFSTLRRVVAEVVPEKDD